MLASYVSTFGLAHAKLCRKQQDILTAKDHSDLFKVRVSLGLFGSVLEDKNLWKCIDWSSKVYLSFGTRPYNEIIE